MHLGLYWEKNLSLSMEKNMEAGRLISLAASSSISNWGSIAMNGHCQRQGLALEHADFKIGLWSERLVDAPEGKMIVLALVIWSDFVGVGGVVAIGHVYENLARRADARPAPR